MTLKVGCKVQAYRLVTAVCCPLRRLGAEIVGCGFLVDLPELGGADRITEQGVSVRSLCAFEGH